MARLLRTFSADSHGATSIEYALIASFIAMVIVGTMTSVGTNLDATFNAVAGGFN